MANNRDDLYQELSWESGAEKIERITHDSEEMGRKRQMFQQTDGAFNMVQNAYSSVENYKAFREAENREQANLGDEITNDTENAIKRALRISNRIKEQEEVSNQKQQKDDDIRKKSAKQARHKSDHRTKDVKAGFHESDDSRLHSGSNSDRLETKSEDFGLKSKKNASGRADVRGRDYQALTKKKKLSEEESTKNERLAYNRTERISNRDYGSSDNKRLMFKESLNDAHNDKITESLLLDTQERRRLKNDKELNRFNRDLFLKKPKAWAKARRMDRNLDKEARGALKEVSKDPSAAVAASVNMTPSPLLVVTHNKEWKEQARELQKESGQQTPYDAIQSKKTDIKNSIKKRQKKKMVYDAHVKKRDLLDRILYGDSKRAEEEKKNKVASEAIEKDISDFLKWILSVLASIMAALLPIALIVGGIFLMIILVIGGISGAIEQAMFNIMHAGTQSAYLATVNPNDYEDVTDAGSYMQSLIYDLYEHLHDDDYWWDFEEEVYENHPDIRHFSYSGFNDSLSFDVNLLVAYLTAKHGQFNAYEMRYEIESLFEQMYNISVDIQDSAGICYVTLETKDFEDIIYPLMNDEETSMYEVYRDGHGNAQIYGSVTEDYIYITSPFNPYREPLDLTDGSSSAVGHYGTDLGAPSGTNVIAPAHGTITLAGWNGDAGMEVALLTDEGFKIRLMHNSAIYVSVGQEVEEGDLLALSGATGGVTGAHIHIGVISPSGDYIDPEYVLKLQ